MKDYRSTVGIHYEAVERDVIKSDLALPLDVVQPKPLVKHSVRLYFPKQLIGRPWDELSLAVISGYQPQIIRVTEGEITTSPTLLRCVTVFVDKNNVICEGLFENISVSVDIPESWCSDPEKMMALRALCNGEK